MSKNANSDAVSPAADPSLPQAGDAQQFKVGGWVSVKHTGKKNSVQKYKGTVLAVGRKGEVFTYKCEDASKEIKVEEDDLVIKYLVLMVGKYYVFPLKDQVFSESKKRAVCIGIPSIDNRDHYTF